MWTPDDLCKVLNKARRRKLHVVSFDTQEETLTVRLAPVKALDWETEARQLARDGKKINAIKLVREHMGIGLAEAKNLVETWT